MNVFHSLGVAGWAFGAVLKKSLSPRLWSPFLLLGVCQGLLLLGVLNFFRPGIQGVVVPLLQKIGGDQATHYPFFYAVLPVLVARVDLVVGVLVSSWLAGVSVLLFAEGFGHPVEAPWRTAGRRYFSLALFSLIVTALVFGVFMLPKLVPSGAYLSSRVVRWGTRFGVLGLAVLVETLFAYGTAWIVLGGRNVVQALGGAVSSGMKLFIPTFLLVLVPAVIQFPFSYLGGRADLFVTKFRPEVMAGMLGTEIVIETMLSFFLAGTVTYLFLWREESLR